MNAKTDNLALWKRFEDIDPKFTKQITGKDYGGTSPSPQYVIRCLTELFGPVGHGFGWRIIAEGFQPLGDQTLHWCRIEFWTRHGGEVGRYEAYGQTKAAYPVKGGPEKGGYIKTDEDAPKKSLTDAIVKAASQVGIAANIFLGRWDDSKYVAEVNREYREAERQEAKAPAKDDRPLIEQMGPAPKVTEPVPPRDPGAVAASLMKLVRLAQTEAEFNHVLARPKFDSAWEWLALESPELAQRVKEAVEEARERVSNPIPLPPQMQEAMDEADLPGAFR